jgi:hypothetical protein
MRLPKRKKWEMDPELRARKFWARTILNPETGCRELQRSINKGGYGRIVVKGKYLIASRFAYILAHGRIPKGKKVLHTCRNRRCVEPKHLYAGTPYDNVWDMIVDGTEDFFGWKKRRVTQE